MLYWFSSYFHNRGCKVNSFFINWVIASFNISILMRVTCLRKLWLFTSTACCIFILFNIHVSCTYTTCSSSYYLSFFLWSLTSFAHFRLNLNNNHIFLWINFFLHTILNNFCIRLTVPNIYSIFFEWLIRFHILIDRFYFQQLFNRIKGIWRRVYNNHVARLIITWIIWH